MHDACTRREMESLVGILQHACSVISPGKTFLQRAISLLSSVKCQHHHIRLNSDFRSDIIIIQFVMVPTYSYVHSELQSLPSSLIPYTWQVNFSG